MVKLFALFFLFVVAQCYTNIEEEKMVDEILDEFLGELNDESDKETMNDLNSPNKKRDTCSFNDNSACAISDVADGCTGTYYKNLGSNSAGYLKDACNKLDVCYACGSKYGKTESECRTRFWEDAKLVCACKDEADQARCASDAALIIGSKRFFDNNVFVAAADSNALCSADCILNFMSDVSI